MSPFKFRKYSAEQAEAMIALAALEAALSLQPSSGKILMSVAGWLHVFMGALAPICWSKRAGLCVTELSLRKWRCCFQAFRRTALKPFTVLVTLLGLEGERHPILPHSVASC